MMRVFSISAVRLGPVIRVMLVGFLRTRSPSGFPSHFSAEGDPGFANATLKNTGYWPEGLGYRSKC